MFDWKPYFLPKPSSIWSAFVDNLDLVWDAAAVSGRNALVGLLVGTVLGVAVGFLLMRFRLLNDMLSPLAIALNAIPIIVLVAVFNNMFAITSEIPRRLMVTLVVYFIVLVNVAKGLRQVEPTHLELMRSYAATPTQVLTKARIPNAVPYLFTAIRSPPRTPSSWPSSPSTSAGHRTGWATASRRTCRTRGTPSAWAYVLGACLLGLVFYLVSILLESITTHQRGASPGGGTT